MPIQYNPNKGQALMCDFSEGFKEPEMVKERAVIVLKAQDGQNWLQSFH
jgi:mRNA interferase MazF